MWMGCIVVLLSAADPSLPVCLKLHLRPVLCPACLQFRWSHLADIPDVQTTLAFHLDLNGFIRHTAVLRNEGTQDLLTLADGFGDKLVDPLIEGGSGLRDWCVWHS
jgi:hypothetical protein